MNKAKKLRELFANKSLIRLVGAHNGLTAKLVELNGFDGVWASSLEVSASHAVPDANILTMTEYLNAAISMNNAVSIPVVVDVDQGYGNSINVMHAVKKFEAAGIAGIMMEDKLFPKQNSLLADGRQELASIPEFVGKVMAAKNAQVSKDFMVMARVEALIAGWGQEEAMKRAKAYVEAGADAIMIHSKKSEPDEVVEFVKNWKENVPLVVVPTNYYTFDEDEIKKYPKIKMVIYANHCIRSVVGAINETLKEIRETGGIKTVSPKLIPVKHLFDLQGTTEMKEAEKRFLFKDMVNVIIPASGVSKEESLKSILSDTPLTLLDINGKSILQRTKEILASLGVTDVTVIGGPNSDKLNIEGIKLVRNEDYDKTHILHSIMKAKDSLKGKTLLVYSDILFEKGVIEKLLKSDKDITLVIDGSVKESKERAEKLKERDVVLVKAEKDPVMGERVVRQERENKILEIGKKINVSNANFEYIGMALFSAKGIEDLKRVYEKEKAAYEGGTYGEASSFDMANLHDLLMKMISDGYNVHGLEIHKGWMEVHTFDDYKRASRMLAG